MFYDFCFMTYITFLCGFNRMQIKFLNSLTFFIFVEYKIRYF